ncbi:MAG: ACT domain-containing protein [Gammaproteobacteria bacterium]
MSNYLAVSVLGEAQANLIEMLARAVADCKCSIVDSRMTVLGEISGLILLVQGNWNTLSRLETQLQRLANEHNLNVQLRRTNGYPEQTDLRPYAVEVSALDQAGIVQKVTGFFASRSIPVQEMVTRTYTVPHTGTPMSALNLVIGVPAKVHIGILREEFMDFCDDFNWDAVLEPVKS